MLLSWYRAVWTISNLGCDHTASGRPVGDKINTTRPNVSKPYGHLGELTDLKGEIRALSRSSRLEKPRLRKRGLSSGRSVKPMVGSQIDSKLFESSNQVKSIWLPNGHTKSYRWTLRARSISSSFFLQVEHDNARHLLAFQVEMPSILLFFA